MARRRSPLLLPSFICSFQAGQCRVALCSPLPLIFGCCGRDAVPGVGAESLVRGEPLPQFPLQRRHRPGPCPVGGPVRGDLALSLHVGLGPAQSCVGTPGVGTVGWDVPCACLRHLIPSGWVLWRGSSQVNFPSFFPVVQRRMELLGLSSFLAAGSLLPLASTPRNPNPFLSGCLGDTPLP